MQRKNDKPSLDRRLEGWSDDELVAELRARTESGLHRFDDVGEGWVKEVVSDDGKYSYVPISNDAAR